MTLYEYIRVSYDFGTGENGLQRTMRRKTPQTLGLFGKGGNTPETPFKPVREAISDVLACCHASWGPCSRHDVLEAIHKAAEAQELDEFRRHMNR